MTIPSSPRAVVTGAGSGLGRALCLELAKRRARVLVSDIDLARAEQTAHEVERAGGQALAERCDVTQAEQIEALAVLADERFGGCDLVANNAGVGAGGPVGEVSLRDWEWVVGINLWGVIHGCHAFVPRFRRQRSGHVLNIASLAGLISAPNMAPYNVSKAGVVALSETLFGELAESGVGVTVVCPSFFTTAIMDNSRFAGTDASMNANVKKAMAASKVQAPEVALAALACCERNQLYCLPMADARWGWRLQRLSPRRFYQQLMPLVLKTLLKQ
jgi:NAD(P)-dependent dehydrogenase (short-subunit alcohol dehydrogenase family)